jgi:hypothetical protein
MDPRYKSPTTNVDRIEDDGFRDLDKFTGALTWLLRAGVLLSALSLISSWMQLELLSRPYTQEEGDANDSREGLIGILALLVFIPTLITFGRWIVLAHRNLPALGARTLDFTPGWALGWFFIPIANLWKPYQAMRSLWLHSRSVHRPEAEETTWVLPVWWTMWLVSASLGNAAMRATLRADTIEELLISTRIELVSCAVDVPLYVVVTLLVTRIWQAQREQKERPAEALPAGFADASPNI